MKKLLMTFLLILFVLPCTFGQQLNPEKRARQETYLEISHQQKKTWAIILGTGAAVTLIGFITYSPPSSDPFDIGGSDFSYAATSIGIVTMITSIPFFISSGVNKRRAMRLSFNVAPQSYINSEVHQLALKPQPAIKIVFKF